MIHMEKSLISAQAANLPVLRRRSWDEEEIIFSLRPDWISALMHAKATNNMHSFIMFLTSLLQHVKNKRKSVALYQMDRQNNPIMYHLKATSRNFNFWFKNWYNLKKSIRLEHCVTHIYGLLRSLLSTISVLKGTLEISLGLILPRSCSVTRTSLEFNFIYMHNYKRLWLPKSMFLCIVLIIKRY